MKDFETHRWARLRRRIHLHGRGRRELLGRYFSVEQGPVDEQDRVAGVVGVGRLTEDLRHSLDEEPVAGLGLEAAPGGYVGLGKQLLQDEGLEGCEDGARTALCLDQGRVLVSAEVEACGSG